MATTPTAIKSETVTALMDGLASQAAGAEIAPLLNTVYEYQRQAHQVVVTSTTGATTAQSLVTVQLNDYNGNAIASARPFHAYLSATTSVGGNPAAPAAGSTGFGTAATGQIVPGVGTVSTAAMIITNGAGLAQFIVTDTGGTDYLNVITPDGKYVQSGLLIFHG